MISITRKQGIIGGAALVAVMLVAGAYYGKSGFGTTPTLSAEETDEILKNYAAKDTDADGVPDWQELLYKTDPTNPHSVRADITDKEALTQGLVTTTFETPGGTVSGNIAGSVGSGGAKAGTMTEKFALTFFESYVKNGQNVSESDASLNAFVQGAVADVLKNQDRDIAYTTTDVRIRDVSVSAYSIAAEKVFRPDPEAPEHDALTYFSDAVLKQDAQALRMVLKSSTMYERMAGELIATPAPASLATAHLSLANALAQLGKTLGDMATLTDDPVRAMIGFGNYPNDLRMYVAALGQMYDSLAAANFAPAKGAPGYNFYGIALYGKSVIEPAP